MFARSDFKERSVNESAHLKVVRSEAVYQIQVDEICYSNIGVNSTAFGRKLKLF